MHPRRRRVGVKSQQQQQQEAGTRVSQAASEATSSWSFHVEGVTDPDHVDVSDTFGAGHGGDVDGSGASSYLSSGYRSRCSGATFAYWTAPDSSEIGVGETIDEKDEPHQCAWVQQ
ncbi:hypothetical protein K435DRAFT_868445 [Dendrothele bispora CBS 962.96]|uniref:Uncharacterized protein n=1 Tax=Dendrothele bispora (strain CBS 962.96) TaxID=1314807 RepID=A0A4S8LBR9_DENBC|nr:hypothetical protein K435DRAFT_868445 [Dendrothele bispora CBS 962.96]